MRRFRDLPIGRKLVLVNLLTSGIALLLAAAAVLTWEIITFRHTMVDELSTQAEVIGYNVASALLFDDRSAATSTLAALQGAHDLVAAQVFTRDGRPFAGYLRAGEQLPDALARPLPKGGIHHRFETDALVLTAEIMSQGERVGWLRLVADLTRLRRRARAYATIVALVFLVAAGAAVLLSARVQRAISDPILDLVEKARIVSEQKDYAVRAVASGHDELGLLVETFNEMLGQIQARDNALEQARDVAEAANRAKDEFLAVVSHELRTPLTPIIAWVRMLRAGRVEAGGLDRALGVIERNARSQAQLVSDLLDVSRIIAGKIRLELQPVELPPLLVAAIDSARPAAEAKGIRLESSLTPPPGVVSGDPERLQQVFWNLLSNAIKFTPAGGRVAVGLTHVDGHAAVSVRDSGQGISRAFLPYVFDRFRQADPTSTRRHGGLGLGLAIVRHMVELHGGRVRAESAGEGQGATFTVELPLTAAPAVARAPASPPPAWAHDPALPPSDLLRGVSVLVVDDDRDTLEAMCSAIRQAGADVRTAMSTADALAVIDGWTPDLLVSDVGMPGDDGLELIRRVRTLPLARGGRMPALALSAYARLEDRLKALAAGFQMHAAKPVDPAELVAILGSMAAWIGKGAAATPG